MSKTDQRRVESHIRRKTEDYYDYLANVGQLPGNVDHMTWFKEGLLRWLKTGEA